MKLQALTTLPWLLSASVHFALAAGVYVLGPTSTHSRPTAISMEIQPRRPPLAKLEPAITPLPAPRVAPPPAPARRSAPRPVKPAQQPSPPPPSIESPAPAASTTGSATIVTTTPAPSVPAPPAAPSAAPSRSSAADGRGIDLSGYLGRINQAVAAHRRYPPMALQLQLEGDPLVLARINRDGSLAGRPLLAQSCGHELLDSEALRMVAQAAPFPPLPADYPALTAELRIPVHFRLED